MAPLFSRASAAWPGLVRGIPRIARRFILGLVILVEAGCLELAPVADSDAPDPSQVGTTLLIGVGGGRPTEIVAFSGFEPLDTLTVPEGRRLFRLAYRAGLRELGLQPGPVEEPASDDPLQQRLPEPDFSHRLGARGWVLELGLPELLETLRIPGTGLEGCAAAGGCYLSDEATRCSLDCREQLDFEPAPPDIPRLTPPACAAPRALVEQQFSLSPVEGQLTHRRCIAPEAPTCGAEERRTVTGGCAPAPSCDEATWVNRVGAADFWVPTRPAGASGGQVQASLQAAIDAASDGQVIAFRGDFALSGSVPGVSLRGRCPELASLALDGTSSPGVSLDHLTLRVDGQLEGGLTIESGDVIIPDLTVGSAWSLVESRLSGPGTLNISALDLTRSQVTIAALSIPGTVVAVDTVFDQVQVSVGGDWSVRGSEMTITALDVDGTWSASSSIFRGPVPEQLFRVNEVQWTDVTLDLEGREGSSFRLEAGGTMERVAVTRIDPASGLIELGPSGELSVRDATFRNVDLVAEGQLRLVDVATFGRGRRAAIRVEGGQLTARRLAIVQPNVALLARRGSVLDLEDVLVSGSGCEPIAIGPNTLRSEQDREARLARPCVQAAFEGQQIPDDDVNIVQINRMAIQDDSGADFLKNQVQMVGEGRFEATDVRLARSPGRGFLFQGAMDVDLTRVVVENAQPLGACFFPGLRFEAYPVAPALNGQPRVRLTDVRSSRMNTGLMLLEDDRAPEPLDIEFDGLSIIQADIGVVRATVQDKETALGLDLVKWLDRAVFAEVPILTLDTPNDACD